ncbi:unnamed protein product, partial [Didymodactylos carnosus]
PGYKKRIPGQGMPLMTNPDKFGDLIIEFDVEYPTALNSDQKTYIKEALIHSLVKSKQQQQSGNRQQRKKSTEKGDEWD